MKRQKGWGQKPDHFSLKPASFTTTPQRRHGLWDTFCRKKGRQKLFHFEHFVDTDSYLFSFTSDPPNEVLAPFFIVKHGSVLNSLRDVPLSCTNSKRQTWPQGGEEIKQRTGNMAHDRLAGSRQRGGLFILFCVPRVPEGCPGVPSGPFCQSGKLGWVTG